ncbi:hypothetical protein D3C81_1893500 [compost metagenome]
MGAIAHRNGFPPGAGHNSGEPRTVCRRLFRCHLLCPPGADSLGGDRSRIGKSLVCYLQPRLCAYRAPGVPADSEGSGEIRTVGFDLCAVYLLLLHFSCSAAGLCNEC